VPIIVQFKLRKKQHISSTATAKMVLKKLGVFQTDNSFEHA